MLFARLLFVWLVTQQQAWWLVLGQNCDPEDQLGTTCPEAGVCIPTSGLCGRCEDCPSGECVEGETICADAEDSRILIIDTDSEHFEETVVGVVVSGVGVCLGAVAAMVGLGAIGIGGLVSDGCRRNLVDGEEVFAKEYKDEDHRSLQCGKGGRSRRRLAELRQNGKPSKRVGKNTSSQ